MNTSAEVIKHLDELTKQRVEEIRSTPNMEKQFERTFFVSCDGNDENDGLSPDSPWATLSRINKADKGGELKYGDAILLRRGDLFRGNIDVITDGVTISAYSTGKKPEIYTALKNYADESLWIETDRPNIYECADKFDHSRDVGFITFDNGGAYGIRDLITFSTEKGCTVHYIERRPFNGYFDLNTDLHFFHDYRSHKLFLYSDKGNPGKRFKSIELSLGVHGVAVGGNNITVDNLCIKHVGNHGVGAGECEGLTVTNCEFGWIGGSVLGTSYSKEGHPPSSRFGNAVEIYGGCDKFTVRNCLVYQVYDAGLTFQIQTPKDYDASMRNIVFADNVILNCYYSIEYFLYIEAQCKDNPSVVENVLFENNLMRFAAHGMCEQRPDNAAGTHIKAKWVENCGVNFVMKNNVFDESRHMLIIHKGIPLNDRYDYQLPKMEGNLYLQTPTAQFGTFCDSRRMQDSDCLVSDQFGEKEIEFLKTTDPTGTVYLREEYDPETENMFI